MTTRRLTDEELVDLRRAVEGMAHSGTIGLMIDEIQAARSRSSSGSDEGLREAAQRVADANLGCGCCTVDDVDGLQAALRLALSSAPPAPSGERVRALEEAEPEAPREVYFARWVASRPCECAPGKPPCFPCGARAVTARAPVPAEIPPKLIERNTSTEEGRAFWASAEQAAAEVESWPDWKRAGINEAESRAPVPAESAKRAPPISEAARRARDPLPPHVLVAALEERIAPVTGRVIATKPLPAESATRDLLRVTENPAVPDGTAYMLSVVEGPDGEKRLDAVKVTGIGAAATKGEEDGR